VIGGEALAPPLFVAGGLLAVSGIAKVHRPRAARGALSAAGLPGGTRAVRGLGAVEVAVGVGCVLSPGPAVASAAMVLYASFALFLHRLIHSGDRQAPCGCLGGRDVRPGTLHVVLNLAAAVVAAGAVLRPVPNFVEVADATPLLGLPLALGVAAAGYLVYLTVAYLPDLFRAYRRPEAGAR
jgi:hypothetical protein